MSQQQIPPIPAGTAGADLIAAINDRLRRINLLPLGTTDVTSTTIIKTGGGAAAAGDVNYGTHALRLGAPIAAFADGAVWYETDRTSWYQVELGAWRWIDGRASSTQAGLPADLAAGDAGFLANVTDYSHVLAWSGSAWTAGPGWEPPGQIRGFMVDPSPTAGWKLCDGLGDDGSAIGVAHPVQYLKADGTLGSITSATVAPCLPNLVGSAAFLQLGSPATGINAAVAPTLTMNSYTPAGTVSTPTFTGSALGTHQHELPFGFNGGTLEASLAFGQTGTMTSGTQYAAAGGAVNAAYALDQAVSAGTPAGTVSTPTFSGTPATLTGTISTAGTPPGVTLRPWFRK